MPKLTTDNLDYCVISSGYTSRLVQKFGFKRTEFIQDTNKNTMHDNLNSSTELTNLDDICEDVFLEDFDANTFIHDKFMFIVDKLWGKGDPHSKGVYYIPTDDENHCNNIDKIQNILTEEGFNDDGIIVFKCSNMWENMRYIEILEKLHYCAIFRTNSIDKIEIIERDGIKILITHIDAESG